MTHSLRLVLLAFASGAAILALASCNKSAQTGTETPSATSETTPAAPATADNTPATAPVDTAADEQQIRNLDTQWLQAVNSKDATSVANMYADDGALLPPNAPMASGHDAILSTWTSLLATPGLTINFAPTKVVVASSGDLAVDIGTYTATTSTADPAASPTAETGKYVVTWVKRNDEWKVLTDMYSPDLATESASEPASGVMPMSPSGDMTPGASTSPMAPSEQFAPSTPSPDDSRDDLSR